MENEKIEVKKQMREFYPPHQERVFREGEKYDARNFPGRTQSRILTMSASEKRGRKPSPIERGSFAEQFTPGRRSGKHTWTCKMCRYWKPCYCSLIVATRAGCSPACKYGKRAIRSEKVAEEQRERGKIKISVSVG